MVFAANGRILSRGFDKWTPDTVRFTARVNESNGFSRARVAQRPLPDIERPLGRIVIRPARLYDGLSDRYVAAPDIVIEGGRNRIGQDLDVRVTSTLQTNAGKMIFTKFDG